MGNKNPAMLVSKQKQVLLIVWALAILFGLPPTRQYFFQTAYFFPGVYGARDLWDSVYYLLLILAWSVILSIPKYRTEKNIIGAACSFLTLGLLLQTYASLPLTGSLIFLLAGFALLHTLTGGVSRKMVDKAAELHQGDKKAPVKKILSTITVWASVFMLALPWFWVFLSGKDFFLRSMRGVQDQAVAAPLVFIMLFWAVLLSFPAKHTVNARSGAAASLLAIAVFFRSDPEFFHASMVVLLFWQLLLNAEFLETRKFARKVKKVYVTPTTDDSELASFYQAVSQKIDSYVASNFPSMHDKKLQGQAYVSIPIKEDGSIYLKGDGIKLETSSGNHDLDLAALSIARRSGPFLSFSKSKSTGRETEVRVIFYRLKFEEKQPLQDTQLSSCM
jgi:hypothetical protein